MEPDPIGTEQRRGAKPPTARQTDCGNTPDGSSVQEGLSAAAPRYSRPGHSDDRLQRRRTSLPVAVLAALVVGAIVTVAGRFEYRCAATMRITGQASPAGRAAYRKELLDFAWDRMANVNAAGVIRKDWFVDSPGQDFLRLCLTTSDPKAGVEYVRSIATGYRDKMRALATTARDTPTEAEDILTNSLADLQVRASDAQTQVDAAIASLPVTDASAHRQALVARWQDLEFNFIGARRHLAEASASVAQLQSEPEPTHGVVPSEDRRKALDADDALQQDLRELAVNLTELKLHLLNVWQRSAGPLEELAIAVNEIVETSSTASSRVPHGPAGAGSQTRSNGDSTLAVTLREYLDRLDTFAFEWNREFAAAKRLTIDPYSGEVLDAYQRIRRHLNDFLFDAARRLAAIRSYVYAATEDPRNNARQHVFRSNLMRAFQDMQAGHHRFEFAAGTIEIPDNFRLDVAIRAARGLRRRSQGRIKAIEHKLQAKAAERARKHRIQGLAEANQLKNQARADADATIDELLAVQKELNMSTERSEAFLRAFLKAEVAAARLKLIRKEAARTEDRLHKLAGKRAPAAQAADIELVSCGVMERPVNLTQRLKIGGLGAALTLFTVLLAQWWITRKVQPQRIGRGRIIHHEDTKAQG